MSNTKFELNDEQQKRVDAWFKHHWDVVHKGFHPPDFTGFVCQFIFGPTSMGTNAKVVCVWCPKGHQGHECDFTLDDNGEFVFQYDENWNPME